MDPCVSAVLYAGEVKRGLVQGIGHNEPVAALKIFKVLIVDHDLGRSCSHRLGLRLVSRIGKLFIGLLRPIRLSPLRPIRLSPRCCDSLASAAKPHQKTSATRAAR